MASKCLLESQLISPNIISILRVTYCGTCGHISLIGIQITSIEDCGDVFHLIARNTMSRSTRIQEALWYEEILEISCTPDHVFFFHHPRFSLGRFSRSDLVLHVEGSILSSNVLRDFATEEGGCKGISCVIYLCRRGDARHDHAGLFVEGTGDLGARVMG